MTVGALLSRAADEAALIAAWSEIRERGFAKPVVDPAVAAFDRGVLAALAAMSQQLRGERWRPQALRKVEIPEDDGGTRELHVPVVADRVVERAVLGVVEPLVDPALSPFSFAYRSGRGVRDAIRAVAQGRDRGLGWCVRTDIAECFDSIPRRVVLDRLGELVDDEQLLRLIRLLVTRPVQGERPRGLLGRGLSQGCALSPLLCNLYLDGFDRRLAGSGRFLVRYADDIAVPAASRADAQDALDAIRSALSELGLEPSESKTRIISFAEGVPYLGSLIGERDTRAADDSAHPIEATVYVKEPGALIRSRGDRVRVTSAGRTLFAAGFGRVRQIVTVGRVGMTTPFLHRALAEEVDVVLLDEQGGFRGRLSRGTTGNVDLRRHQYRAADDEERCLAFGRAVIAGKIANMRVMLLRSARQDADAADLANVADRLARHRVSAPRATSPAELMGIEGAATRDYFAGLGHVVGPRWRFTTRQRRPPPDPVNAMLSFGYTLLAEEATAALQIAGLDPELGLLHTPRQGRPSLALDLMEEFRPVIVDSTVARLIANRQIEPTDFDRTTEGGCRMTKAALTAFLDTYERRLLTLVAHRRTPTRISYRVAILAQARTIADWLLGRIPEYTPHPWR